LCGNVQPPVLPWHIVGVDVVAAPLGVCQLDTRAVVRNDVPIAVLGPIGRRDGCLRLLIGVAKSNLFVPNVSIGLFQMSLVLEMLELGFHTSQGVAEVVLEARACRVRLTRLDKA